MNDRDARLACTYPEVRDLVRRNAELGQRIRAARRAAGLSLVEAIGGRISQPHLSLVERGRKGMRAETLVYLAERLGMTIGQLLPSDLDPRDVEEVLRAAEDLAAAGECSRAVPVLRDLLAILPEDRPALRARCLIGLGSALVKLRQYEFAEPYVMEAIRVASQAGDLQLLARAYNTLGQYYLDQSRPREALSALQTARHALGKHARPDPQHLFNIVANLGQAHRKLGDPERALACYEEAAAIARSIGDTFRAGGVAHNAANALRNLHRYHEAESQLEIAEQAFSALGRNDLLVHVENGLGILFLELGEVERAITHLERAVGLAEQVADDLGRARTLVELGRAHLLLHRPEAAEPYVQEAVRLSMRVNDAIAAARAETLRAEILAGRGHLREAEAALQFVIPIFEEREQRNDLVEAYRVLGRVLQAGGRHAQASDALQRAIALARGAT